MSTAIANCVRDAVITAVHQSDAHEFHGNMDTLCEVVAHEFGMSHQGLKEVLAKVAIEFIFRGDPYVTFAVAPSGELNFADNEFVLGYSDSGIESEFAQRVLAVGVKVTRP